MKKSMVKKNAGEMLVESFRIGMVRKKITNVEKLGKQAKISRAAIYARMLSPGKISLDQLTRLMRVTGIPEITIRASDTFTIRKE